jgi:uncharacterized protein YecE (DUF72 family)
VKPRGRPYIGTSGWSYAHWSRGRFYPKGLPSRDWLAFYAESYSTVEINLSFYRIPQPEMIDRWVEIAPQDFQFALKLWRGVTHLKKLADADEWTRNFFEVANRLGEKRGPLLVQLPPNFRRDIPRLESFLQSLPEAMAGMKWRVAVEFRHPDWLVPEVYALLDRYDVALCLADLARCPITTPNNASFLYVRRHGWHESPEGRYGDPQIEGDAARTRQWLEEGRDVYIYYNNDLGGHAVDNATKLKESI